MAARPGSKRPDLDKYTPELADEICGRIADGLTLEEAIKGTDELPPLDVKRRVVSRWLYTDRDGFFDKYYRAQTAKAHKRADEMDKLADASSRRALDILEGRLDKDSKAGDKEAAMLVREAFHHGHKMLQIMNGAKKEGKKPHQVTNIYALVKEASEGRIEGGAVEVLEHKAEE